MFKKTKCHVVKHGILRVWYPNKEKVWFAFQKTGPISVASGPAVPLQCAVYPTFKCTPVLRGPNRCEGISFGAVETNAVSAFPHGSK